jgi:hypothetical protein
MKAKPEEKSYNIVLLSPVDTGGYRFLMVNPFRKK